MNANDVTIDPIFFPNPGYKDLIDNYPSLVPKLPSQKRFWIETGVGVGLLVSGVIVNSVLAFQAVHAFDMAKKVKSHSQDDGWPDAPLVWLSFLSYIFMVLFATYRLRCMYLFYQAKKELYFYRETGDLICGQSLFFINTTAQKIHRIGQTMNGSIETFMIDEKHCVAPLTCMQQDPEMKADIFNAVQEHQSMIFEGLTIIRKYITELRQKKNRSFRQRNQGLV